MTRNNLDYCVEDGYWHREKNILKKTLYGLATIFGGTGLALTLDGNEQYGKYIFGGMCVLMTAVDVLAYRAVSRIDRESLEEKKIMLEMSSEEAR